MRGSAARTFGVEEEYLLLDDRTGHPADRAAEVIRELPRHRERADREFFSSQLETATEVCTEADEAEAALLDFRAAASRAAALHGVVLAGTGLPPVGGDEVGTVTPKARYREIESEVRSVAAHQYVTGTHVHVAVPSRDAGVDVIARIARWAPALIALTANSPIWCGRPTGFASWRHIKSLAWPLSGYPPEFARGDDYTRAIDQLVASGILVDPGLVTWVARLSDRFPTIELRIADAQLDAEDAVAFAVLVRALVDTALQEAQDGVERPRITPGVLDGAIWMAARNGLASDLVDPLLSGPLPAFDLIDRMLESARPALQRFGDLGRVEGTVDRFRAAGGPAAQQLATFEASGVEGLLARYRGEPIREGRDRAAAERGTG